MDKRRKAYPDKARQRVKAGKLAAKLQEHALGDAEMSATQIRAAEILLKKVWPDLKSTELSGAIGITNPVKLSDDELAAAIQSEIEAAAGGQEAETGEE
jgi:hypothetical protein